LDSRFCKIGAFRAVSWLLGHRSEPRLALSKAALVRVSVVALFVGGNEKKIVAGKKPINWTIVIVNILI